MLERGARGIAEYRGIPALRIIFMDGRGKTWINAEHIEC